jgi:hypothetical protein
MNNQVKSRQQIAEEFGVSTKTLSRWLKKENIDLPPGFITPKWQKLIYSRFGSLGKARYDPRFADFSTNQN